MRVPLLALDLIVVVGFASSYSGVDAARWAPSAVKRLRTRQPEPVLRGCCCKRLCPRNVWAPGRVWAHIPAGDTLRNGKLMTVTPFSVLLVKFLYINQIAFRGGVSYCCFGSASILSASRLPSLLVTRGFRDHAHVVPYFSYIVPFLCGVSAFVDAAAARAAEGRGARPSCPGSWRWNRRVWGSVRG